MAQLGNTPRDLQKRLTTLRSLETAHGVGDGAHCVVRDLWRIIAGSNCSHT